MNIIKTLLPYSLKRKIKESLGVPSLHRTLVHLKKCGFNPKVIFDIGAYEGLWSKEVAEVFPSAKILMIEAQNGKREILKRFVSEHPNTHFEISLLSEKDGEEKIFYENETASHVSSPGETGGNQYKLFSRSLDSILNEKQFPLPSFLKLDVQGHELEVLKGGSMALAHSEVCLLEVTLLDIGDKIPLLAEVIIFMTERNFQVYDISHFMRRPYDNALYQLDIFFIKKDSLLIANKRWA